MNLELKGVVKVKLDDLITYIEKSMKLNLVFYIRYTMVNIYVSTNSKKEDSTHYELEEAVLTSRKEAVKDGESINTGTDTNYIIEYNKEVREQVVHEIAANNQKPFKLAVKAALIESYYTNLVNQGLLKPLIGVWT